MFDFILFHYRLSIFVNGQSRGEFIDYLFQSNVHVVGLAVDVFESCCELLY